MQMEIRWLDYKNSRRQKCRKLQYREAHFMPWRDVQIESEEKQDEHSEDKKC